MSAPTCELPRVNYEHVTAPETLHETAIARAAYEARERISSMICATTVARGGYLSHGQASVWIKDETQQAGGSFKDRGASNAVAYQVAQNGVERVLTASAGNHGYGVARAASLLGIESLVFVGASATTEKQARIRQRGAEVRVQGRTFDDALQFGLEFSEQFDEQFIAPTDPSVMAGHATMGLELLEQVPDMTHLVLPVGSGGMLAGVGSVVKEHRDDVQIVAAQVRGCDAFTHSLQTGRAARNWPVDGRFEGVAVGTVNPAALKLARRVVDRTIVVEPDSVYETLYQHWQQTGQWLETAGAVSPAAARVLAAQLGDTTEARVVSVASGANPPGCLEAYVKDKARLHGW